MLVRKDSYILGWWNCMHNLRSTLRSCWHLWRFGSFPFPQSVLQEGRSICPWSAGSLRHLHHPLQVRVWAWSSLKARRDGPAASPLRRVVRRIIWLPVMPPPSAAAPFSNCIVQNRKRPCVIVQEVLQHIPYLMCVHSRTRPWKEVLGSRVLNWLSQPH